MGRALIPATPTDGASCLVGFLTDRLRMGTAISRYRDHPETTMQVLTFSTMTNAVPSRRAAVLATLTARGLDAAATRAATIDAASFSGGGLLDAVAPNIATVFSETLAGVLEFVGYGYAALLGIVLAAVLCRAHSFARRPRRCGRAQVADAAVRLEVEAVR